MCGGAAGIFYRKRLKNTPSILLTERFLSKSVLLAIHFLHKSVVYVKHFCNFAADLSIKPTIPTIITIELDIMECQFFQSISILQRSLCGGAAEYFIETIEKNDMLIRSSLRSEI